MPGNYIRISPKVNLSPVRKVGFEPVLLKQIRGESPTFLIVWIEYSVSPDQARELFFLGQAVKLPRINREWPHTKAKLRRLSLSGLEHLSRLIQLKLRLFLLQIEGVDGVDLTPGFKGNHVLN